MLHRMNPDWTADTAADPAFNNWFDCLRGLADGRGLSHLIGDAESHQDAFFDGLSPEEELRQQVHAAVVNG